MDAGDQSLSPEPDVIAAFYSDNAYPPPVADLDAYRVQWESPERRRFEHYLMSPSLPFREDPTVLIAGCGTSQAARHAMRWPQGRVVGVDVAESSLRYTAELQVQHRLDNLELHQLPIERVGELGLSFDVIVCTGVLHHLVDPLLGLTALTEVLAPTGAIQLMVYARYGRQGVSMLQHYAKMLSIGTTEGELADLTSTLAEIPVRHPLAPLLHDSADFKTAEGVADALLNPRETSYSVPELLGLIADAGLTFGRWYRQAPYLPECGVMAATPHAPALAALPLSAQYAAMELFRGTMTRHTLIAHTARAVAGSHRAVFQDDWRNLVPIRSPDAVTVTDHANIPSGAAGVLINRAHTSRDLVLPVDESQARIVASIDGVASNGELLEMTRSDDIDSGGAFHELMQSLWSYDQAVFAAK